MIRRLAEDVRGRLRTGVALTSLAQCVEELVLNSVDAGASCVAVRVDLQALTINVLDNGVGISSEQLLRVGERYCTSKCHTVDDLDNLKYFGYRGEALASLVSASSFVEIITRPANSTTTYSKCFRKGRQLSVTEPSVPRPGTGTTIIARDLFYNLPVRKKSLQEGLELERIRFRVAGLALMWPLVSFSLRDDVTGNIILQTHKCSSTLSTFSSLFGGARAKHLREVEAASDVYKVSGYVSRENYSRKDLQFVFVNRRLVLKSKVHKLLNAVLSKSVLVRKRGNNAGERTSKQSNQDKSPYEGGSPTKLFERYAVYVVNIDCPLSAYDVTFDPAKTLVEFHDWPAVTAIVENMLMKFLKEENLLLPSEECKGAGGVSNSTNTTEKKARLASPDIVPESDDPFNGADDGFDEDFHVNLQRKQYTQGISTHTNLNAMFSRTIRRPAKPQETENFGGVEVSSPKKSRLTDDSSASTSGSSVINLEQFSSRTALRKATVHEKSKKIIMSSQSLRASASKRGSSSKHGGTEKHRLVQNINKGLSYAEDDDDGSQNDDETQSTVPPRQQLHLHSARESMHQKRDNNSQALSLSQNLSMQVLPSQSDTDIEEIRLPSQFAPVSSLSKLRARLAGMMTPSPPAPASNSCENEDMPHQKLDLHRRDPTEAKISENEASRIQRKITHPGKMMEQSHGKTAMLSSAQEEESAQKEDDDESFREITLLPRQKPAKHHTTVSRHSRLLTSQDKSVDEPVSMHNNFPQTGEDCEVRREIVLPTSMKRPRLFRSRSTDSRECSCHCGKIRPETDRNAGIAGESSNAALAFDRNRTESYSPRSYSKLRRRISDVSDLSYSAYRRKAVGLGLNCRDLHTSGYSRDWHTSVACSAYVGSFQPYNSRQNLASRSHVCRTLLEEGRDHSRTASHLRSSVFSKEPSVFGGDQYEQRRSGAQFHRKLEATKTYHPEPRTSHQPGHSKQTVPHLTGTFSTCGLVNSRQSVFGQSRNIVNDNVQQHQRNTRKRDSTAVYQQEQNTETIQLRTSVENASHQQHRNTRSSDRPAAKPSSFSHASKLARMMRGESGAAFPSTAALSKQPSTDESIQVVRQPTCTCTEKFSASDPDCHSHKHKAHNDRFELRLFETMDTRPSENVAGSGQDRKSMNHGETERQQARSNYRLFETPQVQPRTSTVEHGSVSLETQLRNELELSKLGNSLPASVGLCDISAKATNKEHGPDIHRANISTAAQYPHSTVSSANSRGYGKSEFQHHVTASDVRGFVELSKIQPPYIRCSVDAPGIETQAVEKVLSCALRPSFPTSAGARKDSEREKERKEENASNNGSQNTQESRGFIVSTLPEQEHAKDPTTESEQILSQNSQGFVSHSLSSIDSQPILLSQSCMENSTTQNRATASQGSQSFTMISTQGFLPQASEEGTLSFDAGEAADVSVPSSAGWSLQTDSPASTAGSTGFSPAVLDPLLACDTTENMTNLHSSMFGTNASANESPKIVQPSVGRSESENTSVEESPKATDKSNVSVDVSGSENTSAEKSLKVTHGLDRNTSPAVVDVASPSVLTTKPSDNSANYDFVSVIPERSSCSQSGLKTVCTSTSLQCVPETLAVSISETLADKDENNTVADSTEISTYFSESSFVERKLRGGSNNIASTSASQKSGCSSQHSQVTLNKSSVASAEHNSVSVETQDGQNESKAVEDVTRKVDNTCLMLTVTDSSEIPFEPIATDPLEIATDSSEIPFRQIVTDSSEIPCGQSHFRTTAQQSHTDSSLTVSEVNTNVEIEDAGTEQDGFTDSCEIPCGQRIPENSNEATSCVSETGLSSPVSVSPGSLSFRPVNDCIGGARIEPTTVKPQTVLNSPVSVSQKNQSSRPVNSNHANNETQHRTYCQMAQNQSQGQDGQAETLNCQPSSQTAVIVSESKDASGSNEHEEFLSPAVSFRTRNQMKRRIQGVDHSSNQHSVDASEKKQKKENSALPATTAEQSPSLERFESHETSASPTSPTQHCPQNENADEFSFVLGDAEHGQFTQAQNMKQRHEEELNEELDEEHFLWQGHEGQEQNSEHGLGLRVSPTYSHSTTDSPGILEPSSAFGALISKIDAVNEQTNSSSHENSKNTSQQSNSFSDSVPDIALANMDMPENQHSEGQHIKLHEKVGAAEHHESESSVRTGQGMLTEHVNNTPYSLPDSEFAKVAMTDSEFARVPNTGEQSVNKPTSNEVLMECEGAATSPANKASLADTEIAGYRMPQNEEAGCSSWGTQASVDSPVRGYSGSFTQGTQLSLANNSSSPANKPNQNSGVETQSSSKIQTELNKSDIFTQNAYNLGSARSSKSTVISSCQPADVSNQPSSSTSLLGKSLGSGRGYKKTTVPSAGLQETGIGGRIGVGKGESEENQEEMADASSAAEPNEALWIPIVNPATGSTVYMNNLSGHTLTQAQWNEKEKELSKQGQRKTAVAKTPSPQRNMVEELSPMSHRTLEAMFAEHFETEEEEAQSKWREGSRRSSCEDDGGGGETTVEDILASWQNPVFQKPEQILQATSRSQAGRGVARCFFEPTTFTKQMLAGAKVIGQLDNKFIACLIHEDTAKPSTSTDTGVLNDDEEGLLVLFDQHAAHERVRLEQLTAGVYEKDGSPSKGKEQRRIQRSDVQPPRTVLLSEEDVRLMLSFKEEYERVGVVFEPDQHHRDRVHVHTIPACMAQREANDRKRGKDPLSYEYLEIMIREHNQLLRTTAGARQQLPQQVFRLLATHACKGAIKFGDKLMADTSQELIASLASCNLPFQCAHGRPSIAPLLSLRQLKTLSTNSEKRPRPKLWKLRQKMSAPDPDKDQ